MIPLASQLSFFFYIQKALQHKELYDFEEGTPIVVTFSEFGNVTSQFVFLDDVDTLSNARDTFEQYKCSVNRIDID